MKTIKSKFKKLDNVDKFGIAFGLLVIIPLMIVIIRDLIINGANLV